MHNERRWWRRNTGSVGGRLLGKSGIHIDFALREFHLTLDDLKQFIRLRNSPRLQLTPHRHIVQRYFKGPRGHELHLDNVAQKEEHHTRIQLVLHTPSPPAGLLHLSQVLEDVKVAEDAQNHQQLAHTDQT